MGTLTPLPPSGSSASLVDTVRAAVGAMTWLTDSDAGMVGLALAYAEKIDAGDDAKTVGWLGPHLANALRALGGAPAERKALGVDEQVRGKLAQLRAARG